MEDMGVNMAGVEVILKLREKMVEMQHRINLLETELRKYKKIDVERKNIKSGG
jgi:BMFP domain-containing protein YqiC